MEEEEEVEEVEVEEEVEVVALVMINLYPVKSQVSIRISTAKWNNCKVKAAQNNLAPRTKICSRDTLIC